MKKLLLVSLCFLVLCLTQVFAQNRTVTGTVTAKDDGLPIPGVTVKIKGTNVGVPTDVNGKFSISAPSSGVLVFSFIGYKSAELPVPSGGVLNVSLEVTSSQLNEVVVTTALGIQKSQRDLGYANTNVTAKELTEAHPTNFTNGLTAKVAGLVVTTTDNGINPTTRFTLRGNRHITGNNFALVVLNGVPISPNDVNTINPDDIESTNVENGAGAAALYGSEASNGVLIITTKKGTSSGAPEISYTNTFQMEKVSYFPALQTRFGSYGGEGGIYQDPVTGFIIAPVPFENQSYGPAYNGALTQLGIPLPDGTLQKYPYSTPAVDPRKAFFNTGHTEQNNISYAFGDAQNFFRLTANRDDRTSIIPGDNYQRTIARLSAGRTYGMFHGEFTASYSQSYTSTYGGNYSEDGNSDLFTSLLNTPSWVPLGNFKNTALPFADVNTYYNSYDANPYWMINNSRNNSRSDAFNGSFTGILTPAKWVDVTYRIADNFGTSQSQFTREEVDFSQYAKNDPTGGYGTNASILNTLLVPGQVNNVTQFGDGTATTGAGPQGFSRLTQDVIVSLHHTFFNDFKTNLRLGNTIWQEYLQQISNSSNNLFIKDFYNIQYISGIPTTAQSSEKIRQISYFGDLTINYKDIASLEGTLRNEHDSRLSAANRSIYYPSVNGSVVLTNALPFLKDNKVLNYLKLRATYSQVGDVNISPYGYVPTSYGTPTGFPYGSLTALSLSTQLNNPNLKPEITKEYEFGFDFGFLNDRINGAVTYYNDQTINQTLPISTDPATGYTTTIVNVGQVSNTGYEFRLDGKILTKSENGVLVDFGGNFAIQNSKVLSLPNGLNSISLSSGTPVVQAIVGQPYPVLVGTDLNRDPSGHVIVDAATGMPSTNPNLVNLGRTTPKYILGLTQNISYKFITLTLVEDFRTGNVIYNASLASATAAGSSANTASAGRLPFVFPNSVINTGTAASPTYVNNTNTTIQDGNIGFWDNGSYFSVNSSYVTSGAYWKLREADLEFDLTQWVKQTKAIKKAYFAINGRNLLMWRPKSNNWTDPEFGNTSGNATGINTTGQLPPTRIFGATLNVTF